MAKTVTFESKFAAYAIVRAHKVQVPSPTGIGYQTTAKGLTYQFQPVPSPRTESGFVGVLTVKAGQDRLVDGEDFLQHGEEVGKTRDAVEALMACRAHGEDFWVQGWAPGTLLPREVDVRREITQATAKLDDDRLAEMIAEERRTHGRAPLLQEAADALEVVQGILAEARAEAEAAEEPPKAKAKAPAAA